MALRPKDPLLAAGHILTFLMQGIVALGAVVLTGVIPALLIFRQDLIAEIAADHPGVDFVLPVGMIVIVLALAVVALVLLFLFFKRLRQIIATVGEGDPFVPQNAERLSQMAWLMLATHVIALPIMALGAQIAKAMEKVSESGFHFEAGLDGGSILLIITLFILARVFRQGTKMRADLEGTV